MSEKITFQVGGNSLTIESGRLAKQADGSVTVQLGETIVLVAAVAATAAKPGQEFFPLTVDYREKAAAAGVPRPLRIQVGGFSRAASAG